MNTLNTGQIEASLAYWRQKLDGSLPVLDLPADFPNPAVRSSRCGRVGFVVPAGTTGKLRALARQCGTELETVLLAAFQILLHRLTGQEEVLLGWQVSGQEQPGADTASAPFTQTLILRTHFPWELSFNAFLAGTYQSCAEGKLHQHALLEGVLEAFSLERDGGQTPLFQAVFEIQAATPSALVSGKADANPEPRQDSAVPVDLRLTLRDNGQEIFGTLEFSTDLFKEETISRWTGHYQTLLEAIADSPGEAVGRLRLLRQAEYQQIVGEWNETQAEYANTQCVHQLFEEQVRRTPDAVAVVFEDQALSYRDLNSKAESLARRLVELGVGPDVGVGICMLRSLEMVIGLYAIHKAGGAYVPLDPSYPPDRLAFMLADSQTPVLLTQQALIEMLPPTTARVVCVEVALNDLAVDTERGMNPRPSVTPDHLAYIIYTSGSTGKPKGVMVRHRNVVNFFAGMDGVLGDAKGVWLAVTSISFDISVLELFWTLTRGFKVVLQREESAITRLKGVRQRQAKGDGAAYGLAEQIARHGVTHIQCTPSLAVMMLQEPKTVAAMSQVKTFLFGGEPLPPALVQQLAGNGEIINMYGPTETTVWSTAHPVTRNGGAISIGRPIANTRIYIVDRNLQPVPIGVRGELLIGGAGVVRGYLNRRELTAERFIPDMFSNDPAARLYRTGDLARYQADGAIEFLGRMDHQVKLRGFRIELGEIEAALREHPKVKESAVSVWEPGPNDKRLVGYIVPRSGPEIPAAELRRFLKDKLPEYMVPSAFQSLNALPLTPNGKVDRKALPVPEAQNNAPAWREVVKVLPLTEAQWEIWHGSQTSDEVSCSFNQSIMLLLRGPLDQPRLAQTLEWMVDRHEALRVTFPLSGKTQELRASAPIELVRVELSGSPPEGRQEELRRLLQKEMNTAFNLANGPLFRARLVTLAPREHALIITLHHIVCDGGSLGVILQELGERYSALVKGESGPAEKPQAYSEFVLEQQAAIQSPNRADSERHWLEQFSRPAPNLELPTDRVRPSKRHFAGASAEMLLSGSLGTELKRLSAKRRCTLVTTLLAGYYLLLHRLTGQSEIIVGLPMTSRWGEGSDRLVGHCVNFLPLRLSLEGNPTFAEHLSRVWSMLLDAHAHHNYTLGTLLQKLNLPRNSNRMPLTSVMFNLDWVQEPVSFEGLEAEIRPNPFGFSRFDMVFSVAEFSGQLELYSHFSSELFDDVTIRRWFKHYETLMAKVVANPDQRISDLSLLSETEQSQLTAEWSRPQTDLREIVPSTALTGLPPGFDPFGEQSRIYVLDLYRQPCPIGVYGRLCIGGPGIDGRESPDTWPDPFRAESGMRLFPTSIQARFLPSGRLEMRDAAGETAAATNRNGQLRTITSSGTSGMYANAVEETLAKIWCEVICVDQVRREDNFFDVGGHSLLATQVASRIAKAFNIELPLRKIFEAPTLAELAEAVNQTQQERPNSSSTITRRTQQDKAQKLLQRLGQLSEADLRKLIQNPKLKTPSS